MWGDLGEWDQDEGSLGKARVRDFESRLAEDEIAEEENIEVEGAGAVGDAGGAVTAEAVFDCEQSAEQFSRRQIRFERENCVDKAGLAGEPDGSGGVERRPRGDAAQRFEALRCGGQRSLGRAGAAGQVGTEADVGGEHPSQDYRVQDYRGVQELPRLAGRETRWKPAIW